MSKDARDSGYDPNARAKEESSDKNKSKSKSLERTKKDLKKKNKYWK